MNYVEAAKKLIDEFPWAQIRERMYTPPRWRWANIGVPSIAQLKERAAYLFTKMAVSQYMGTGTGGIHVARKGSKLTLSFGKGKNVWATASEKYEDKK